MKIKNTPWQTIAEENKQGGGILFGYEAPASEKLLREIQKNNILIEVVGKTSSDMPRLIRPDNSDPQVFTPDQRFRIMEKNKTFDQFEKTSWGERPPEDRFDKLVNWINPNVWEKTDKGYFLRLDRLSDKKQEELRDNLKDLGTFQKGGISVSGKGNIKALEFTWKMARNQLRTRLNESCQSTSMPQRRRGQSY